MFDYESNPEAKGVEYQITEVDPTDSETKGKVYQVYKVTEEIAATMAGKIYRARIIKDPTESTVIGKVYQVVFIDDPGDPSVKGKVYNAIVTGLGQVVVIGPAVSPLVLPDAVAGDLVSLKAFGGCEQGLPSEYQLYTEVEAGGVTYTYSSQNLTQIPCMRIADNVFGLYNLITQTFISEV